jgi:hypothetical protein
LLAEPVEVHNMVAAVVLGVIAQTRERLGVARALKTICF